MSALGLRPPALPLPSSPCCLLCRKATLIVGHAAACARPALAIFEGERPDDRPPRVVIDAAQAFADGAGRTRALRDHAWVARRAARAAHDAEQAAASEATPAAAHAARAFELSAGKDDPAVGAGHIRGHGSSRIPSWWTS
ncbi:MAG TPA: hypothetical protein VKY90_05375 [Candidatus Dormibacteraeota bacterium]|nr:hypothetical protein [Candidatus Dormibacteraeota bacterium]